eukprot:TRINITY_DN10333_c0_g1_i2.p1 TRINITY_DN10333_c0_g1~~TRINITY_DN10333_c0_g1_i2.p1  ORF type:complete len:334 (+),score=38.05 TRINITY_DN10333_c0_g1_i2:68-1003(+)
MMKKMKLLPTIFFAADRQRCEEETKNLMRWRCKLVTEKEKSIIYDEVTRWEKDNRQYLRKSLKKSVLAGYAYLHPGCLPSWIELVESLSQKGLVKLVFQPFDFVSNFQAKSTIISTLENLSTNQLYDLAARANSSEGDKIRSVILRDDFSHPKIAVDLVKQQPECLTSQFCPDYGMLVNTLKSKSLDETRVLLQNNFFEFKKDYESSIALEVYTKMNDVYEKITAIDASRWIEKKFNEQDLIKQIDQLRTELTSIETEHADQLAEENQKIQKRRNQRQAFTFDAMVRILRRMKALDEDYAVTKVGWTMQML